MDRPQALDAERAVLRSLLDSHELLYDMEIPLKPSMFFGMDNAIVFQCFLEIFGDGKTPDEVLIKSTLAERGQLNVIGGDAFFENLSNERVIHSNINEYTKAVMDAYLRRKIIDAGIRISESGYKDDASNAMSVVFSEADNLSDLSTFGEDTPSVDSLMFNEYQLLLDRIKNPGSDGIKTMINNYDLLTGGLHKTDEVILAGRPSSGKTTIALRWMLNLAKNNIPSLFFSFEMSQQQLMQRFLSMESGIKLSNIRSGMVMDIDLVNKVHNDIRRLPIYISNNYSAGVDDIITESRKMIRRSGVQVVFVDHIQLVPHRVEMATQDLGGISRKLKGLAIESNLVVVLLSQLNRMVEMRAEKIPILSDLRQSGNLEEHADAVVMLYREEMYNPKPENKGTARLYIRKNRNGQIGMAPLRFKAETVDFMDL